MNNNRTISIIDLERMDNNASGTSTIQVVTISMPKALGTGKEESTNGACDPFGATECYPWYAVGSNDDAPEKITTKLNGNCATYNCGSGYYLYYTNVTPVSFTSDLYSYYMFYRACEFSSPTPTFCGISSTSFGNVSLNDYKSRVEQLAANNYPSGTDAVKNYNMYVNPIPVNACSFQKVLMRWKLDVIYAKRNCGSNGE